MKDRWNQLLGWPIRWLDRLWWWCWARDWFMAADIVDAAQCALVALERPERVEVTLWP